jgi:hypothetical protein
VLIKLMLKNQKVANLYFAKFIITVGLLISVVYGCGALISK